MRNQVVIWSSKSPATLVSGSFYLKHYRHRQTYVRREDRGPVSRRLSRHVHQRAGVRIHYPDRSLGGDEHRLHRLGELIATNCNSGYRSREVRQFWHKYPGKNRLPKQ